MKQNYKTITISINKKKKKIKAKICSSLFSRMLGMMFKSKKNAEPLFFIFPREQNIGLHMLFVFFSIEAVWFNQKMKEVSRQKLKPWAFSKIHKAKYILEVPIK